ncbi:MAG: FecR domain-containing protein [Puia sp.]|nr:FecR domain-containing protein [Puia sp.]
MSLQVPLTPDELDQLDGLVEEGLLEREVADDIRNGVYDAGMIDLIRLLADEEEADLAKQLEKIRADRQPIPLTRNTRNGIWLKRIGGFAAAILLSAGLGILYKNLRNSSQETSSIEAVVSIIPPAVKGASLKLADGSVVALDSTAVGSITNQGGNRVEKKTGGAIAYENGASAGINTLFNTLTTARGQRFQVDLPDGTKAWLNAGSSLTYFARLGQKDTERRVTLQGEAFFDVAPNKSVPFVVVANGTQTTVLGTHFNVAAYPEESAVSITLLRGSVRVAHEKNTQILKPGQAAVSITGKDALHVDPEADTSRAISWKEGYFQFDEPLDQAMRELARWYNVGLDLQGSFHDRLVAREPREVPLSDVLRKLEEIGAGHFKIVNKTIIVTR